MCSLKYIASEAPLFDSISKDQGSNFPYYEDTRGHTLGSTIFCSQIQLLLPRSCKEVHFEFKLCYIFAILVLVVLL
jgi:hypothetical protein